MGNKWEAKITRDTGKRLTFQLHCLNHKAFHFSVLFHLLACAICLLSCTANTEKEVKDTSTKFQQYYVNGEKHYLKNCSNCHQKNGTGLGLVYPPLNKSDYMNNNFIEVICLIRHGKSGDLMVNGKIYNQRMYGIPTLTDLEIAEIATYIYNSWEHKRGMIDVHEVAALQKQCNSDTPN
jgi:cytochrome c551